MCPATISASIMAATKRKSRLRYAEFYKNKISYKNLFKIFKAKRYLVSGYAKYMSYSYFKKCLNDFYIKTLTLFNFFCSITSFYCFHDAFYAGIEISSPFVMFFFVVYSMVYFMIFEKYCLMLTELHKTKLDTLNCDVFVNNYKYKYFSFVKYLRTNENTMRKCISSYGF